ncbi:hypothetical protein AQUCO_00700724v1 [Aquilegia coerulea]|uniref:KIB1-4 beta-propeller domain-containing protein n=1 Tax=Aquilegia coerulea TaxID=218851 RepID=A0A2G5ELI9_AQUCA|nr:hypothetical protein AQUCO_00700724v1 [Aquilegia coerulea]
MLAESGLTLHQRLLETGIPRHRRGFVVVGEQHIQKLELPEVHDTYCIGSSGTWLIIVDIEKKIHLLNPFSRVQIDLPSLTTLENDYWERFVTKVIISSTPTSSADCIAMAIHLSSNNLAIARPGDEFWTTVETPLYWIDDIIFYQEQFYTVNVEGKVMVCNIGDGGQSPKFSVLFDDLEKVSCARIRYLVEWLGEILLVEKFADDSYITHRFKVYKLDFASRKWIELKSLGEHSLFLGLNTSVSVLASDDYSGWVKKNCIYFTFDNTLLQHRRLNGTHADIDVGVFDLEDNSIKPLYEGISTSGRSRPVWIIPAQTNQVNIRE